MHSGSRVDDMREGIADRFERQVSASPTALAVASREGQLTYGELGQMSRDVAGRLLARGVGPEVLVGVAMERTPAMIAALLGTLAAGGAYLPIATTLPRTRIRSMLEEARPAAMLVSPGLEPLAAELGVPAVALDGASGTGEWDARPAPGPGPDNLAYVLYTSGSTGRPKGVAITHGGAAALLHWAAGVFTPAELRGVLASTSIGFDLSVFEIFLPLTRGGAVVLVEDLLELPRVERASLVTLVNTVPSVMAELLRQADLPSGVVTVNLAGEPLPAELAGRVHAQPPVRRVLNLYGPTEATTYATCGLVPRGCDRPPSIGRPIAGTRASVLDPGLEPAAPGAAGELHLGGAGLARGYVGRPDLTAERFVPDPGAGAPPGSRMYRTGDRVRGLADGELEYLGRSDGQVKVRGHRVEVGEVESALRSCAGVAAAAVTAAPGPGGAARLVAYVVRGGVPLHSPALRAALRERLPAYMVPAAFVELPALPLTANGKLDRAGLPPPTLPPAPRGRAGVGGEGARTQPSTPTEAALVRIWSEVLGVDSVGVDDDFLELGGNSLLATHVLSRVGRDLGVWAPPAGLLGAGTIRQLGLALERERSVGPGMPALRRRDEAVAPLGYAQRAFWFWWRLAPASGSQNLPLAVRVRGALDASLLEESLCRLVARHHVLRSTFRAGAAGEEQVVGPARRLALVEVDLRGGGEAVRREAAAEAGRGFDLAGGALLRARLLRIVDGECVLLLTMPHIVSDGWSVGVLLRELLACYCALRDEGAWRPQEPALQYGDYAAWQREAERQGAWRADLEWWRARLRGAPRLELEPDAPRGDLPGWAADRHELALPARLSRRLRNLARAHGVTISTLALAVFQVLLARHTGERDVVVGVAVAGRGRPELEGLVGPCLNLLPVRVDLSGGPTFGRLLERVRESTLGAYAHQDVPLARLVEELGRERELSRSPLFQAVFNSYAFPTWAVEAGGLSLEPLAGAVAGALADLTLYLHDGAERLRFELVSDRELFEPARMAELLRQLRLLLQQVAGDPGRSIEEYSLVTAAGRRVLPDPSAPLPARAHAALPELVARHAGRVALVDRDGALMYGELVAEAGRLAARLRDAGAGRGSIVAIRAARDRRLVVAILGVLRAGAAFTVLDPAHPPARLDAQLAAARPHAEVDLDLRVRRRSPHPEPRGGRKLPDDLAYVAFTSGTQGLPKGILGAQGPVVHFLEHQAAAFGLTDGDRFSLLSGLSHDPVLRDVFAPLALGAVLCIPDERARTDPRGLRRWLREQRVTVAHLTPLLGRLACSGAGPGELPDLRLAFFGGDTLTRGDVRAFRRLAPRARIVNSYGTTETPQAMAWHEAPPGEGPAVVPIGTGIPCAQVLVLNGAGGQAGLWEHGEIHVRTPYLTRGYLGDEAATRARYVANPVAPGDPTPLYVTGDRGCCGPLGEVRFGGRLDAQVKVRGFRVEPAEVELALRRHPEVRDVAVVGRRGPDGETSLAAYVVAEPSPWLDGAGLRAYLSRHLPAHMVPATFTRLDALPLTANAKLDAAALPDPEPIAEERRPPRRAPAGPAEELVSEVWREVLGVAAVGRDDNFFDLGGSSVALVRVQAALEARLGRAPDIVDLFQCPDVRSVAHLLATGSDPFPTAVVARRVRAREEARRRRLG